jgi:hypothetical protein
MADLFPSWPPAIHVFVPLACKDVDARHKAGHDDNIDVSPAAKDS